MWWRVRKGREWRSRGDRGKEGGGKEKAHSAPNSLLAHLIQPLHVERLCPVLSNGGIPTVSREIIDEALQKLLESFLGLLNIHIRPPDNEVGLRGCLTGHSRGRRLTSLQCTSITIHSHTPQYVHRTQYVVHGTYVGTFVRSHQEN